MMMMISMTTTKEFQTGSNCLVNILIRTLLFLLLITSSSQGVQETSEPRISEHPEDQFVVRNEAAMLNCKADGQPLPVITWYRNGQLVVTTNDNPSSHRMLLPSGQLFFLRVVAQSTKGNRSMTSSSSDAGLYYCNATNPLTATSVTSRNATIAIAMIRDEFREHPQSSRAATGESIVLPCRGPRGDPEPQIKWKKDGEPVAPSSSSDITASSSRVYVHQGNLHLNDLRKTDAGLYTCIAYNPGGHRDSKPAELTILDKPKIAEVPAEVFHQEDSDVLLPCRATGDAELVATWKRRKGILPAHRSRVLDDRTLRIKKVKVQDEGIYVCRVENSVGWQEAEIRLNVRSQPTFVTTPSNKWVGVGRRVSFECEANGNPVPAIFWKRENSQSLMFPGESYDRHSIKQDATMVIEGVQKTDAGVYVCQAQSIAGTAIAKARLDVKDVDSRPPPIIFHGPQNQTLPINSLATLQCSASGDPLPAIRWFKNNRILSLSEPRFVLLDSGTLQIHELRRTDTGWYTCKAISETGETAWSGSLSVEAPTDPSIIFRRTPDPSTYPGPPSRPLVSEVRETSVRLAWKPSPNNGASPVSAFTVEYFSHETGEGWTVDSDRIREPFYVVRGLRPDTVYRFLVRSQNSQGLSLPSPVTNPVRTKVGFGQIPTSVQTGGGVSSVLSPDQNSIISLSKQPTNQLTAGGGGGGTVHLGRPEAIGSTSMQLRWEVRKNPRAIEGFHIHYCAISRSEGSLEETGPEPNCDLHSFPPAIQTVQNGDARTHVLNHLEESTWYRISLRPYYLLTEGHESNHVYAKTHEDVPSAAPTEIKAVMSENNTLHLTWQPPPKQHQNGLLTGYKIFLSSNESQLWHDIWTNVSSGEAYVYSLSKDIASYHIQIAAYSNAGEGVRSEPLLVEYRDGREQQPMHERDANPTDNYYHRWLTVTVISCLGCVLWVAMCTLAVWLYRRRRRRRRRSGHKGSSARGGETVYDSSRQIKPSTACLASGGGGDDTRGMLENTYENVASIKAAITATASTTGHSTPLHTRPLPERSAVVGGPGGSSSFGAAVVPCPCDGIIAAYQPGLPINYPSSSGFSSSHLIDPFYEAYIIKPKPVYACTSNPDTYAGQPTSGYYETSAPNSPEYVRSAVGPYPFEATNFPQGYCTLGRRETSRDKQKISYVSAAAAAAAAAAGGPLLDYSDPVQQRKMPSIVIQPNNKSHQLQHHAYQSTNDTSASHHRTQMRPPSVHSPPPIAYNNQDFSLPPYNDPRCHAYQFLHYPYPSHTIQPRTSSELRYAATSSPHATSEPEQLPTYAGEDEVLGKEATVVRYFSETDGLLDNGRKHQYPPSPAPMEHLISVNLPATQGRLLLEGNRTETSFHGNQSDDILLNNERNLQPSLMTAYAK